MPAEASPSTPNAILDVLPNVIGTLVSLSAVGYFIGWRQSHAYYSSIGASWAATSIPPQALLQQSSGAILAIVSGAFYSFVLLNDRNIKVRTLTWICAGLLVFSSVFLSISQGLFGEIPPLAAYGLASAGAMACAVAAGITAVELYGSSALQHEKRTSGSRWLVYWFVLPGLIWAPDRLGQAQAIRDTDPAASPLPSVVIDKSDAPQPWRLVHIHEGRALLLKLGAKSQDRQFKLVEAKDIASVSYVSPSTAQK